MLKSDANPGGTPLEVFDAMRAQLAANRAQFYRAIPIPFYGFNRTGAKAPDGVLANWWRQAMMGAANAQYECIEVFSETDFNNDLKGVEIPTLVLHGDDDQIVPCENTSVRSTKILKNATLKIYPGYPHGMLTVHADKINPDLLEFIST
jgi:non-heme chloroperoxidase